MGAVALLIPVLRRPHRVAPLLASIRASTPEARTLFIADPFDEPQIQAVKAAGADLLIVEGNYATKINAAVAATDERLLFLGADDLDFKPGWLTQANRYIRRGAGVVGTNDLGSPRVKRGEHSTHSLVTRRYAERGTIDEPGKLLHEGYPHEFVDDEFVETAKFRGAWAFAHDAHVEHLHPSWGKAPMDDLYRAQKKRMRVGRTIYQERRHLWTAQSSSPPTAAVAGAS